MSVKPPLSVLGRSIVGSSESGSGGRVLDLIEKTANKNIAFAKLLLDQLQNTQSFEEIERVHDRLDDDQVVFFASLIRRVEDQKIKSERDLGLAAISALGSPDDLSEKPFSQLEDWLRAQNLLDQDAQCTSEDNLNRVLHAACGLIVPGDSEANTLSLYHENFALYVLQDYNERIRLVRRTTSLDEA